MGGFGSWSQSPYGAKWFATDEDYPEEQVSVVRGRNPLTGLSGLQPFKGGISGALKRAVAIPLRG